MVVHTCPPSADLEKLLRGGEDAVIRELEEHVLECRSCLNRLQELAPGRETWDRFLRGKRPSKAGDPVVETLLKKLETLNLAASETLGEGPVMITFLCPSCQKKLSVKEALVGKKVKCPGCGQVCPVPADQRQPALPKNSEQATLPPSARSLVEASTRPPRESENPTLPPQEYSEATHGGGAGDPGPDAALTDFLHPPQAPDELGRLGKYRILKILGHGGMGVVYLGEDPQLKRRVAIKAMLPTMAASASAAKRFLREAETMAQVEHDHIVRVYQVDEDRGVPFLAMEFLRGEPLDQRLEREGKLTVEEAVSYAQQIAEGLAAAHDHDLVHRDIKPGNIWLEDRPRKKPEDPAEPANDQPFQRVKILDFGLARAASQDSSLTQQGAIIGTPAYMAPEQARGDNVDARCDLWSLGVVLYRMTTGQQPFQGKDTVSTLMAVAVHDPTPPSELDARIPVPLSQIIMKLLEKDPNQRFPSAHEVVRALKKLDRDRTEIANPLSNPKAQGRVASPRSKWPLFLGMGGVLALLIAGLVFFLQTSEGTVRIEITDPGIKVAIDDGEFKFTGADPQEIRLKTGPHGLKVQRDGFSFETTNFEVKKGEMVVLKVEWVKDGKVRVAAGEKVMGELAGKSSGPPSGKKTGGPDSAPGNLILSLDETGLVEIPTVSFANITDVTIEARILLDPRPASGKQYQAFMGEKGQLIFHMSRDPKEIGLHGKSGAKVAEAIPGSKGKFVKAILPQPPRWIHVAGVRLGKKMILFVDGKNMGESNYMPNTETGNFFLGGLRNCVFRVDEIRLSKSARYDREFTPQERFEPDANTLALFHCDEGDGNKLIDSSGNNNHGQVVGARWFPAGDLSLPPPNNE